MKLMWKRILGLTAVVGALAGGVGLVNLDKQARIAVGYKVKLACSEVFVAGRNFDDVVADSFFGIDDVLESVALDIDYISKNVSGSLFGLGRRSAKYRKGFGCTVYEDALPEMQRSDVTRMGTEHASYEVEINAKVQQALMGLFPKSTLSDDLVARGAVVIKDGKVIAENYRDGFDKDTPQLSWSVAKGIMQSLVGIAVGDGMVSIEDDGLMPEWQDGDPRNDIQLKHMLHMASGLEFNELYKAEQTSDVATMLFDAPDTALFSARKKLISAPGTVSQYSSGTSNMISHFLRERLTKNGQDYLDFPNARLFSKIGMDSAVFELDAAGVYVASSYVYATPRDFGRFGQLILQDGVWNGERILPEGWVNYTMKPALGTDLAYGSQWFLNLDEKALPGLPKEVVYLFGNEGQFIFVIPSQNTVIVRTGLMHGTASFENDIAPQVRSIYQALSTL